MKNTKYILILGLVLLGLFLIMNTASAVVCLGSNNGRQWGEGGPQDCIFIQDGKHTLKEVYDTANITTAIICEIASGAANSTYLVNASIQVNETGVLIIDSDSDWVMLSSIDGAIANITSYGRLFINGSLVTAVVPAGGGLNNSVNDTTYATGAKSRPYIAVNNSETTGDGAFGLGTGTRIAYLGGNLNESYGGVCINDTGGTPVFTATNTHISHCYDGLFIKSIISGTALSQINVTNCERFGIRIDSDSAINFTASNSTNNGIDWQMHSDVYSDINNTDANYILGPTSATGNVAYLNNVTQKYRLVHKTRGSTVLNATSLDVQVTTSDNDYCNCNFTSLTAWTGETLDADFVQFVIGGYGAGGDYTVSVTEDGINELVTADSNGHITYNYTGSWSTKTFSAIQHTPSGGGGSGAPIQPTTYYKCVHGKLATYTSPTYPGEGWLLYPPECEDTTSAPTLAIGGEVSDTVVASAFVLIIIAFLAIWKVPYFKKFGSNKWLLFLVLLALILIIAGII